MTDRRATAVFAALCALGALVVAIVYLSGLARVDGAPVPPLDDTYIHLQYGKLFAHGQPFAYVAGEGYTTGATSPAYVVLLAPWFWVLSDQAVTWIAFALGALALAATAFACGICAARLAEAADAQASGWRARAVPALAAAAAVLATGTLAFHALSGMETGVYAATVTGALALVLVRGRPTRVVIAMLALLPLVRPDGVAITIVLGIALVAQAERARRRRTLALVLCTLAPLAMYLACNLALTGDTATAGMHVKSYTHDTENSALHAAAQIVHAAGTRLGTVFGASDTPPAVPWLVAPLALVGLVLPMRSARRVIVLAVLAIGYLVLNNARGNLHGWQRYFTPLVPVYLVSAIAGAHVIGRAIRRTTVALALDAIVVVALAALTHPVWRTYLSDQSTEIAGKQVAIARAIRERVPGGERVVTMDVGATAFLGERPTFDVIGLTTRGAWPYALLEVPGRVELLGSLPTSHRPRYAAMYLPSLPPELVANVLAQSRGFVLYELEWRPIDAARVPDLAGGDVVDAVDVADPASERAHDYEFTPRGLDYYDRARLGTHPVRGHLAVDAARPVTDEQLTLAATPGRDATVVVRTEAPAPAVSLTWNGTSVPLVASPGRGFVELVAHVPATLVRERNAVHLHAPTRYASYRTFLVQ